MDFGTRIVPRAPAAGESLPCLEDERLHLLATNAEDGGDVLVRVISKLEEHEGGALIRRQPLQVSQDLAQLLAPVDLIGDIIERGVIERELTELGARPAPQVGEAAVAGDRVQPGPKRNRVASGAQRPVCGGERRLQRVLARLSRSQHLHAEREDTARVSIVDRLERAGVAVPDASDEQVVGLVPGGLAGDPTADPRYGRYRTHGDSLRLGAPRVQRSDRHFGDKCDRGGAPSALRRPGEDSAAPERHAPEDSWRHDSSAERSLAHVSRCAPMNINAKIWRRLVELSPHDR
jgi:hypothetical protein